MLGLLQARPEVARLDSRLLEEFLRQRRLKFRRERDAEGDFFVVPFLVEDLGDRGPVLILGSYRLLPQGILEIQYLVPHDYGEDEALRLANEWNRDKRWPKACIERPSQPGMTLELWTSNPRERVFEGPTSFFRLDWSAFLGERTLRESFYKVCDSVTQGVFLFVHEVLERTRPGGFGED